MVVLQTARLTLRPLVPDDLDEIAAIRADPEVMRFVGGGVPQTAEQVEDMLRLAADVWDRLGFGRWAVIERATGAVVGWCGFAPLVPTGEVELGYGLARAHWGRGLAGEAAAAALGDGFGRLALPRIVAIVKEENHPSRRVLERIGMTPDGRGHYYGQDFLRYAIARQHAGGREGVR